MANYAIRIKLSKQDIPLPPESDLLHERKQIAIKVGLFDAAEAAEKLPRLEFSLKADNVMEILRDHSRVFDEDDGAVWEVAESGELFFPIEQDEFENAKALAVWADPVGRVAFKYVGGGEPQLHWRGVVLLGKYGAVGDKGIPLETKPFPHPVTGIPYQVINVELGVGQSVVSYLLDLMEQYTSPHFDEIVFLRKAIREGRYDEVKGRLAVLGFPIDKHFLSDAGNAYKKPHQHGGVGIAALAGYYDYGYYKEQAQAAGINPFSRIEWGKSKISVWDFKEPIKKLYGEVIRIGNDGRLYSNESLSNLNWGVVGAMIGVDKEVMVNIANMDWLSANGVHDDVATRQGDAMVQRLDGGMMRQNWDKESIEWNRRSLFQYIVDWMRNYDIYTHIGAMGLNNFINTHDKLDKRISDTKTTIGHLRGPADPSYFHNLQSLLQIRKDSLNDRYYRAFYQQTALPKP